MHDHDHSRHQVPAPARISRSADPNRVLDETSSREAVLALQRVVGNEAVAAMLAEAGRRPTAHDVLGTAGRPLDDATRTDMEARLGADFSDVRLHTDTAAQRSATEVGARAYTSGNHVVIGPGGADPHTLAHELTHVVQQRQGQVAGTDRGDGLRVSDPDDRFERAAEATATRVMAGAPEHDHPAHDVHGAAQDGDGLAIQRTLGDDVWAVGNRYSAQFVALADAIGANPVNLMNALLDPAYDVRGAGALDDDLGVDMLTPAIQNPITGFAACYPTARHLYPILSRVNLQPGETRDALASRAETAGGSGQNLDVHPSGDSFRAEVERLIAAMENARGNNAEAVFRIEFAGHGFTLLLRQAPDGGAHMELIESLAHGASLDRSLNMPGFAVDNVYQYLRNMAADDFDTRRTGALGLGWNAAALFLHDPGNPGDPDYPRDAEGGHANEGEYFPRTRMKWWCNFLRPDALAVWMNQVQDRYNYLAERYHIDQRL